MKHFFYSLAEFIAVTSLTGLFMIAAAMLTQDLREENQTKAQAEKVRQEIISQITQN